MLTYEPFVMELANKFLYTWREDYDSGPIFKCKFSRLYGFTFFLYYKSHSLGLWCLSCYMKYLCAKVLKFDSDSNNQPQEIWENYHQQSKN